MADLPDILSAPARIEHAARAASAIADGVRAVDVAGPVRLVGGALPGSATAAAAQVLAARWQGCLGRLGDGFDGQGSALEACARAYRVNEQQLAEALGSPPSVLAPGSPLGPR